MSISTKRGDEGSTDLMFGRRVSKSDPRVETYGTLDEVNALLGLARVDARHPEVPDILASLQDRLIPIMGELATLPEDWTRYRDRGAGVADEAAMKELDDRVERLETVHGISYRHWAIPGAAGCRSAAVLDLARTVTRRAERAVVRLAESGALPNPVLLRWVNRLSDLLWLLARLEERTSPDAPA
jgi:cob(I)alamin adenosyltransferase